MEEVTNRFFEQLKKHKIKQRNISNGINVTEEYISRIKTHHVRLSMRLLVYAVQTYPQLDIDYILRGSSQELPNDFIN